MLTCIYISEQVLCQQVQNLSIVSTTIFTTTKSTCTLFEKARTGCSKHKRAIWLKFSYPKSPPHPKLVIPKHSSEGHSGICPLSLGTHEAGAAYYLLCFSQNTYKVLGTHELLTHIYWRFKKKIKKTKKKPTKPTPKASWRGASWTKHIDFSKSRQGGQGLWLTDTVPVLARKASCDSRACSPTSHQDLFHSRGFPGTLCATTPYRTNNSDWWVFLLGTAYPQVPYQGLGVLALWK